MKRFPTIQGGRRCWWLGLLGILVFSMIHPGEVFSQKPPRESRMTRQIGVMEKIIDKLLLDSPNFLVGMGNNAHGVYLADYGAIFTFEASLTGGKDALNTAFSRLSRLSNLGRAFDVSENEKGEQVIVVRPLGKELDQNEKDKLEEKDKAEQYKVEKELAEKDKAKADEDRAQLEKLKKEIKIKKREASDQALSDRKVDDQEAATLYKAGKEELVQMLLDYGETLSDLRDGSWLVVAAFMGDNDFFKQNKVSHLVMKVKIDDLRAYSAERLTEDQVRGRIVTEEY